VQDMAHHQHVGAGQRVGEEIAGVEGQPPGQAMRRGMRLEQRAQRRQVEAAAGQVRMGERDLRGQPALGTADIDEAAVLPPRGRRRPWRGPAPG